MLVHPIVVLANTYDRLVSELKRCLRTLLLLTMVSNSLILLGISVYWEKVFIGAIIIIGTAVLLMQAKIWIHRCGKLEFYGVFVACTTTI